MPNIVVTKSVIKALDAQVDSLRDEIADLARQLKMRGYATPVRARRSDHDFDGAIDTLQEQWFWLCGEHKLLTAIRDSMLRKLQSVIDLSSIR